MTALLEYITMTALLEYLDFFIQIQEAESDSAYAGPCHWAPALPSTTTIECVISCVIQ